MTTFQTIQAQIAWLVVWNESYPKQKSYQIMPSPTKTQLLCYHNGPQRNVYTNLAVHLFLVTPVWKDVAYLLQLALFQMWYLLVAIGAAAEACYLASTDGECCKNGFFKRFFLGIYISFPLNQRYYQVVYI